MQPPSISVVICSIDARKFSAATANFASRLADTAHEIIGVHDARSLAEGYNRGARQARGDLLIFSHDDVEILSPDFAGALRRAAASLDVIGVVGTARVLWALWPAAGHPYLRGWIAHPAAGAKPYEVAVFGVDAAVSTDLQALDGMFFAAKRAAWAKVPFDEATFDGFHGYDIDFTFRAHRAGFRVGISAEVALIHASKGGFDAGWAHYAAKFAAKHRDVLAGRAGARSWPVAAIKVATKEEVARAFPLEKLKAITTQLRAQSAGGSAT